MDSPAHLLPPKQAAIQKPQLLLAKKAAPQERCVAHQTFQLLASKWVLVILLALMQGTRRTGELRKLVVGIAPQVLTECLRELEAHGIIARQVFPEVPPRVEYSLTAFGETLCPLVVEMCDWALRWDTQLCGAAGLPAAGRVSE